MTTRLKIELVRRNMRQTTLAKEAGLNPATVSSICNGYIRPTAAQAARIEAVLGVGCTEAGSLFEVVSSGHATSQR